MLFEQAGHDARKILYRNQGRLGVYRLGAGRLVIVSHRNVLHTRQGRDWPPSDFGLTLKADPKFGLVNFRLSLSVGALAWSVELIALLLRVCKLRHSRSGEANGQR